MAGFPKCKKCGAFVFDGRPEHGQLGPYPVTCSRAIGLRYQADTLARREVDDDGDWADAAVYCAARDSTHDQAWFDWAGRWLAGVDRTWESAAEAAKLAAHTAEVLRELDVGTPQRSRGLDGAWTRSEAAYAALLSALGAADEANAVARGMPVLLRPEEDAT